MAYKIIDDETALTIFEAIQEKTTRSFGRYNCQRQLPKHKINGELMFYLDELLDFAERELNQPPEETLGQVVDQGLTAWFANLAPALQRKLGFSLKANGASSALVPGGDSTPEAKAPEGNEDTPPDTKEALKLLTQKNKAIEELTLENLRLKETVETLAAEKIALKREVTHLEQIHAELTDQAPQTQVPNGYLSDASGQSGYMALTTHSLSGPVMAHDNNASKKNKRRRKRKGGMSPIPGNGRD